MEAIYKELMLYLILVVISTAGLTVSVTLFVQDMMIKWREKKANTQTFELSIDRREIEEFLAAAMEDTADKPATEEEPK